jgi:hypothetical protein
MAKIAVKLHRVLPKRHIYQYLALFISCTSCLNSGVDRSLSQVTPTPTPSATPQEVTQSHPVRALPGQLDSIPTFNSNSPEVVQSEGILLSTFPSTGKTTPTAHLNFPLRGRFDVFAHHIAKATSPQDLRTLYLGIIVRNPNRKPVKIQVLQAASYLSQPDAPFIELPSYTDNPQGTVYAGPGDRAMNDVLRGVRKAEFPARVTIPPGGYTMLLDRPIPVKTLIPPLNGRSTLMRLQSDRQVYVASLAMFAKVNSDGSETPPTLAQWQELLKSGKLVTPRDLAPTPIGEKGKIIYGRVAGVAAGSFWKAKLVDPNSKYLSIPQPNGAYSYPIATVPGGTLGTNLIQSAPMLARYPDTAYRAHGNYGIEYSLRLPLKNSTEQEQTVTIALQTPIKADNVSQGLRFLEPAAKQVWFRGTVRLQYLDDSGSAQDKYIHLVQKRGQSGQPLLTLKMPKGSSRLIRLKFLYPPDATPPQVLTIRTEP